MGQLTFFLSILLASFIYTDIHGQSYYYKLREESVKVDKPGGQFYYKSLGVNTGNFKFEYEDNVLDGNTIHTIMIYHNYKEYQYYMLFENRGYKDINGKIYKAGFYSQLRGDEEKVNILLRSDNNEIMMFFNDRVIKYSN